MDCKKIERFGLVIIVPNNEYRDFSQYHRFKITKKSLLWGYWNSFDGIEYRDYLYNGLSKNLELIKVKKRMLIFKKINI